jgi:hypothetical protein
MQPESLSVFINARFICMTHRSCDKSLFNYFAKRFKLAESFFVEIENRAGPYIYTNLSTEIFTDSVVRNQ